MKTLKKTPKTQGSNSPSQSTESTSQPSLKTPRSKTLDQMDVLVPIQRSYPWGGPNQESPTIQTVPSPRTVVRESDVFGTTDLHLAASLKTMGYKIYAVEKDSSVYPPRGEFLFKDSPSLRNDVSMFYCGELRLEPRKLFSEIKDIKFNL
jgi:hypothetical protein